MWFFSNRAECKWLNITRILANARSQVRLLMQQKHDRHQGLCLYMPILLQALGSLQIAAARACTPPHPDIKSQLPARRELTPGFARTHSDHQPGQSASDQKPHKPSCSDSGLALKSDNCTHLCRFLVNMHYHSNYTCEIGTPWHAGFMGLFCSKIRRVVFEKVHRRCYQFGELLRATAIPRLL